MGCLSPPPHSGAVHSHCCHCRHTSRKGLVPLLGEGATGVGGEGPWVQWGRGLTSHLQCGDPNGTPTKKRTFRRSLENPPSGEHCCPRLAVPGGAGAHPSIAGAPGHTEQRIGCLWFFHQARRSRDLQNPKYGPFLDKFLHFRKYRHFS